MLDEKDLQAIDQLMAHRMNIILESEISPKLNLLAEGMEDPTREDGSPFAR